ncbi:MAG: hypothetical protein KDA87_18795, partial [Planctomycetales bacterium]|nr:hypothetical protein [Planctomycetales bacterium]
KLPVCKSHIKEPSGRHNNAKDVPPSGLDSVQYEDRWLTPTGKDVSPSGLDMEFGCHGPKKTCDLSSVDSLTIR